MSDAKAFGFGQFIPGYDFLQQLNKAGQGAALPPFSSWVAPTVSVEEIDKRIEELKAVQFWLEQNGKALAATVQALQVQKMTLSTLKGMNVNLQDFAQAFGTPASNLSNWPMGAAQKDTPSSPEPPKAQPAPAEAPAAAAHPMAEQAQQWWGALTQQFQQIAHQVLQDPAQKNAMAQAASMASNFTKAAAQTASEMMRQAVGQATSAAQAAAQATTATAAKKPAAKKPAATKKTAAPGATAKPAAEPAAKARPAARSAAKPAAPKTRSVKKT